MIEQAKCTYSSFGKAIGKQIKIIEDLGEKHIKAIQYQGQVKTIKKYSYDDKDSPLISKQKKKINKLVDERLDETTKLDEKVNPGSLIYRYKDKTSDKIFYRYDNTLNIADKIKKWQNKTSWCKKW